MLRECEAAVKEATGWVIQLKIKPFGDPLETIPTTEDTLEAAYADMKALWEKDHFYFKPTNTIVEVSKRGDLTHFTLEHATETFNMWKLGADEKGEPTFFLKKWNKDPSRRIIDTLVYKKPEDCKPNEATLFRDFTYKSLEPCENPEAVAQFQDILRAVSGDDEAAFQYNLKWMARIVQKPFEKSGVAVIFINKTQGTGKDTICLWLKAVLGNHVAHYSDENTFWNQYDTKQEGAVLMYLEEVGSGAAKANATALKARLTSATLSVNPKGVKAYEIPNMGNYVMTTNQTDPVRIEGTDRRFFPSYGSDRLRGKSDYWVKFYTDTQLGSVYDPSPSWVYPIGKFLEGVDLTGFNPREMPENEFKNEIIAITEPSEESFLKQWRGVEMTATEMYNEYRDFCMENSRPYATSVITFCKSLMRGYSQYFTKKATKKASVYTSLLPPL